MKRAEVKTFRESSYIVLSVPTTKPKTSMHYLKNWTASWMSDHKFLLRVSMSRSSVEKVLQIDRISVRITYLYEMGYKL